MTLLSGIVKTTDGTPMSFVGVILNPATKEQVITLTNSRGEFGFKLQPGTHRLAVRTFAYRPFTKDLEVSRRGEHLEIELAPTLRRLNAA